MPNRSERINILVVDDENFFAEWLAENLRDTSPRYHADWVNSGERALEFMERHPVDLVISDIKMEGISGIDLLSQIRRRHPGVGVILMTGYDLAKLKQEAIKRGSLFYLEKPFSMERLESTIEAAWATRPPTPHPAAATSAGQLSLLDALHFLHFSRSSRTIRVTSPLAEGMIYYQNGDVVHAHCQGLEGEEAFSQIMSWGSNDYTALEGEPTPKRTIFREFDSLIGSALEAASTVTGVTAQLPLLDALHLFHLSRSNKAILVKGVEAEGLIYYQNGEITHALCQELQGEEALYRIMRWGSNDYEVLTDEPIPNQTIFGEFDALINAALRPERARPLVSQPGVPEPAVRPPSLPPAPSITEPNLRPPMPPTIGRAGQSDAAPSAPPAAAERVAEAPQIPIERPTERPRAGQPGLSEEEQHRLRELLAASTYFQGGALITTNGDILASTLPPSLLTPTRALDLARLFRTCQNAAEQLDRGPHRRTLLEGELGHVILSEIGLDLFLLFVTHADAALGLALFQVGERADNISEVVVPLVAQGGVIPPL